MRDLEGVELGRAAGLDPPMSRDEQKGQSTRGYRNACPHAWHLGIISLPSRAPSQYGFASGVMG